jgi:5-methylcytosine-specific restriction protein B
LNARVRRSLKRNARNLQIGHAYLLAQPITSVADFGRVLRDDIIPLLEEYCYEDFDTLRDILGPGLVDTENGRLREELFESTREDDLIQAVYFEEMQPLVLAHNIIAESSTLELNDQIADDDDEPSDANP